MRRIVRTALTVLTGLTLGLLAAEVALAVSNVWIGRHSDTMF